jgi:hypothetical protein
MNIIQTQSATQPLARTFGQITAQGPTLTLKVQRKLRLIWPAFKQALSRLVRYLAAKNRDAIEMQHRKQELRDHYFDRYGCSSFFRDPSRWL